MTKIEINERGIKVLERDCWMCGTTENITNHHTLYQQLNPKKNVEIPLCASCHSKQHSQDISSLSGLAVKIRKTLQDGINKIPVLNKMVSQKKREMNTMTMGDIIQRGKKE